MQLGLEIRQMEKPSNNRIGGLPDYLDTFQKKDENLYLKVKQEVLDGTFDYEAENKKLKELVEDAIKAKQRITPQLGPLRPKDLVGKPPDEQYIEHLRQKYGLKFIDIEEPLKTRNTTFFSKTSQFTEKIINFAEISFRNSPTKKSNVPDISD